MAEIADVLAAWQPYVASIDDWQKLVMGHEPKPTGCGPVYELGSPLPNRVPEEFAIADMRNILVGEPHYHPNGETEIYIVISGQGNIVVGGKENQVQKGSVVVTPPNTVHFTIPEENLVLGVINVPSFNPANYVPITKSNPNLGFDRQQLVTLLEAAYKRKGLATKYVTAQPGKVYEPDRDIKMHFLTVSGSAAVKVEDELPRTWRPFQELIVSSGQLHAATVGEDGWEYIVAWNEEEAQQEQQTPVMAGQPIVTPQPAVSPMPVESPSPPVKSDLAISDSAALALLTVNNLQASAHPQRKIPISLIITIIGLIVLVIAASSATGLISSKHTSSTTGQNAASQQNQSSGVKNDQTSNQINQDVQSCSNPVNAVSSC